METLSLAAPTAATVSSELIPLLRSAHKSAVSARELHRFLELRAADFARWCENQIVGNPFAVEGEDWTVLRTDAENPLGGRPSQDYALALPFAKKLAMMSKSARGEQARDYFLACEQRAQQLATPPQTYIEALRALLASEEEKERLALANAEMVPKAEFFDAVAGSRDAIEMALVAKVLDFPGIGRTKLFARLRERKILRRDNSPYQEYIDRGYFRSIEQKWNTPDGETHISHKTLVFQRGLDFIRQLLTADVQRPENK